MKKKILIVDDEESIIEALSLILGSKGYAIEANLTGKNLFKEDTGFPDIILLDIMLPGISGLDICKDLKAHAKTKNIPIIIITAAPNMRESATNAGANAFIEKPFNIGQMLGNIEALI